MPLNVHIFRRAATLAVAIAVLSLPLARPAAAAWLPFNPAAGSRWVVETENNTDDTRNSGNRTALIKSRAEMSIDDKTADGFEVTYVLRSATVEGNDPSLPLLRSAMQALGDIPIHASTDQDGRPVRIDNLKEAEAAIRGAVDKETADFDDRAQVVAVLHRMLARLAEGGSGRNAFNYLEALPELARAPDDGTKAGEAQLSFGFGYKDVLQVAAHSPGKKLLSAIGSTMTPMQLYTALSEMEFKFHMKTSTQHKDDMLIQMTQNTVTEAHAFSYDLRKTENRSIKVTPAP
jgi:hypothetical protein